MEVIGAQMTPEVVETHQQVHVVDEASAPPSEPNERRKWTVSSQTDKFNVLIHLYGNSGV